MITKDQAIKNRMFHHVTAKNKDGSPMRARRNGKTKTWVRKPGDFRIPVKHGLYDFGYITQDDAANWTSEY